MKAYKIELLVIDRDDVKEYGIRSVLENTHYPNDCISPGVMKVTEADIGEWHDEHPLNSTNKIEAEYLRLFPGSDLGAGFNT